MLHGPSVCCWLNSFAGYLRRYSIATWHHWASPGVCQHVGEGTLLKTLPVLTVAYCCQRDQSGRNWCLIDQVAAATLACFKLLIEGNVKSTEISSESNSFTCQGQAVAFYFEVNVEDFVFASRALIFVSVKWVIFTCISVPE